MVFAEESIWILTSFVTHLPDVGIDFEIAARNTSVMSNILKMNAKRDIILFHRIFYNNDNDENRKSAPAPTQHDIDNSIQSRRL